VIVVLEASFLPDLSTGKVAISSDLSKWTCGKTEKRAGDRVMASCGGDADASDLDTLLGLP
jgi:hypothetical protein